MEQSPQPLASSIKAQEANHMQRFLSCALTAFMSILRVIGSAYKKPVMLLALSAACAAVSLQ